MHMSDRALDPVVGKPTQAGDGKTGQDNGRKQFGAKDWKVMCGWLEIPGNKECVTGTDGKTEVGVKYGSKIQAFGAMVEYINENQLLGSDLAKVNAMGAKNRFNNFLAKYKSVKKLRGSTGWGLTDDDMKNGIDDIDKKCEKLCPCYARMDALFGSAPNLNRAENSYASSVPLEEGMTEDLLTRSERPQHEEEEPDFDNLDDLNDSADPLVSTRRTSSAIHLDSDVNLDETVVDGIGQPPPRAASPVTPGQAEGVNVENSTHGPPQSQSTSSTGKKLNPKKPPFVANHSLGGRPGSFSQPFAAGMEALSESKHRANEIKERALERKLAFAKEECIMRADAAKMRNDVEAEKLKLDRQKMAHGRKFERQKLAQDKEMAAAKLSSEEKLAQMQLRAQIINANQSRKPEEIKELLKLVGIDV